MHFSGLKYFFSFQVFIESLTIDQQNRLLLEVLCTGRGSLEYARQLVNSKDPEYVKMVHKTGVSAMYVLICPAKKRTNAVGRGHV